MADITSKITLDSALTSVTFNQLTSPVFKVEKISTIMGIWESDPLDGSATLLSWKEIVFSGSAPSGSDRYIFISNTDTKTESPVWSGPYRNGTTSLLSFSKRYVRIRIIMIQSGVATPGYGYNAVTGPSIDSLSLKAIISGTAAKFYSDTFEVGFSPKYALITAETDIPDGTIIRWGIANLDSIDSTDYQFINENKITKLDRLSVTGEKVKVFIEMSGNSGDVITIDEFAVMFSGDDQAELNKS
jgi:hypothetical protein